MLDNVQFHKIQHYCQLEFDIRLAQKWELYILVVKDTSVDRILLYSLVICNVREMPLHGNSLLLFSFFL